MKSMTAFSRQEVTVEWGSLNLEMRTVNHRYLDINMRLAEELRFFEPIVRQMIADSLSRGRVDLALKYQPALTNQIDLNQNTVNQLFELQNRLQQQNPELKELTTAEILNWPGVLEMSAQDEEQMTQVLSTLLSKALEELQQQREVEGNKIQQLLKQKTTEIKSIVDDVRNILPQVSQQFRENFQEKLEKMDVEIDSYRLEQELVIFLGKQDIAEELDRLDVHLDEVEKILTTNQAVGRRLDFLMQELNREANTLTSKSVDIRLNNASVEMKVLIEQMREQVQNIE